MTGRKMSETRNDSDMTQKNTGTNGSNIGPDGFPRMCEHCCEVLGIADRSQAYTCPKCGKWVCIRCHKGCRGIRWEPKERERR